MPGHRLCELGVIPPYSFDKRIALSIPAETPETVVIFCLSPPTLESVLPPLIRELTQR